MISTDIKKQLIDAMKAKDSVRVSTFRMLNSELKNAEIDKGSDLTEEEELIVIKKEAKKRRDAIEGFEKGGNKEAADNERAELSILNEFLPEDLSDDALNAIINEAIEESGAETPADFGKVMPLAIQKVAGRADGKRVSTIVRERLNS